MYVTTKKLSEKTEQNPSEPQPHWSNNIFGSLSFNNPFWSISVRGHSHIQVATRNVQWIFMGGYLNYMYVLVCGNCLAKTYCFFIFNRSVSNAQILFSEIYVCNGTNKKNIEKTQRKLIFIHIKLRPRITWFSDVMRQILKCTQSKQIFSILYYINCESKCLLE